MYRLLLRGVLPRTMCERGLVSSPKRVQQDSGKEEACVCINKNGRQQQRQRSSTIGSQLKYPNDDGGNGRDKTE